MKRTVVVWTALGAAILIGAGAMLIDRPPAFAQAPWATPAGMDDPARIVAQASPAPPAPPTDLRRRLNLTDEQARRVEQIMTAYRGRVERLRIDLARARLDAREALMQSAPDRTRLGTIARRIGDLQAQLAQARFDMLADLRGVLTPEQWSRLQMMRWMAPGGRWRRR
jgi:Spy/CpxP family protein refolding chaperone